MITFPKMQMKKNMGCLVGLNTFAAFVRKL